jgi:hypothetical protein
MKVFAAQLTDVSVPFIRPRFHVAGATTTPVGPDAERQPRPLEAWLASVLWSRAGTAEEEAARAEARAIKARNCSLVSWRLF